jgi:hypothetical protein
MCLSDLFKTKKVYPDLIDFPNHAALEAWFELHTELRMESPNICDDYSRESRALAAEDGYNLEVYVMADGKCYTTSIFEPGVYHVGNLAIEDDTQDCYYIDLAFGIMTKVCTFAAGGKY